MRRAHAPGTAVEWELFVFVKCVSGSTRVLSSVANSSWCLLLDVESELSLCFHVK